MPDPSKNALATNTPDVDTPAVTTPEPWYNSLGIYSIARRIGANVAESYKKGVQAQRAKGGYVALSDELAKFSDLVKTSVTKVPADSIRQASAEVQLENLGTDSEVVDKFVSANIGDAATLPFTVPIGLGLGSLGGLIAGKLINKYIRKRPEKTSLPYAFLGAGIGGVAAYLLNAPAAKTAGTLARASRQAIQEAFRDSFSDDPAVVAETEKRRAAQARLDARLEAQQRAAIEKQRNQLQLDLQSQ